eukprot:scaffold12676_cov112-Isochrysis_galbana.AAC.13
MEPATFLAVKIVGSHSAVRVWSDAGGMPTRTYAPLCWSSSSNGASGRFTGTVSRKTSHLDASAMAASSRVQMKASAPALSATFRLDSEPLKTTTFAPCSLHSCRPSVPSPPSPPMPTV